MKKKKPREYSMNSTYLSSDRLPSNLYILFIYISNFQDIFFVILVHPYPTPVHCCADVALAI